MVTGGAEGIGRELTKILIQEGASVAAVDIDADALAETKRQIGQENRNKLKVFLTDIAKKTEVALLVDQIKKELGPVDALINNAGVFQPFKSIVDISNEEVERVFGINFYGTLHMTRSFLPGLLKRPEALLMNIACMGSFIPIPGQTIYGASKAAVKLLTEGLQSELIETNVHVSIVYPGAVKTRILEHSKASIPSGKVNLKHFHAMDAGLAANTMVDAIRKDHRRVILGRDARTLDRLYRFNPQAAIRFINSQMRKSIPKEIAENLD